MENWKKVAGLMAVTLGLNVFAPLASAESASPYAGAGALTLNKIAGYTTGAGLEEAGAEIVQYDKESKKVYLINGATSSIEMVDLSGLQSGQAEEELTVPAEAKISIADHSPVEGLFGDVTSVAVHPTLDLIAAAVPNADKTQNGSIVFFNKAGEYLGYEEVGALPDMVTVTPDGSKFLVANEGEPNSDYSVDPQGSVSIIDVSVKDGEYQFDATTASFEDPDIKIDSNVRYASLLTGFVADPTPAQWAADFEPEFIAVTEDSSLAYVVLQESNAVAVLDLETGKFTDVHGLGYKNYMLDGNKLDPSDRDPKDDPQINIAGGYPVLGAYMPDGMSIKTINGKTYLFTANEGDSRAYGPDEEITDEVRFKDVDLESVHLNADYYPGTTQEELDALDLEELQDSEKLGRLKLMNTVSEAVYTDNETGETYYNGLFAYGARSFSIWDVEKLGTEEQQVYDSKDDFEQIVAYNLPELFNSDHAENIKDDRSDDKGPEPEYVELGAINGRTYAFTGLERQSAIMVYDVTNPEEPVFDSFVNMRDVTTSGKGDLGPEGLDFVAAENSPTGTPLLLVGNEVSGTLAVYEITTGAVTDDAPFTIKAVEDNETYAVSSADGKVIMTVNGDVTGFKTFGAEITAAEGHEGLETVVFRHVRSGEQLGLSAIRGDFDTEGLAPQAGFNVKPGDVVEVYIVDQLSNDSDVQPVILQ